MEINKTDTKDNLKNAAAYMIRHLSLIVICLSMALYIVLTVTSGANGNAIEYTTICIMGLLLSLTWFVMGEHRRILEKISEIQDEDNEIKCNCDEFNSKLSKIDDGLSSLTTMDNKIQTLETNVSKLLHKNSVSVEIIEDPDEFYKKLKDAESTANVRIWVTHLDPYPPTSRKLDTNATNERTTYFNFLNDFAKAHPKVEVKRIIGISTIEKLEWLKEQMILTKDIDNISFAYIRADCFGNGDSPSPLTVVSCQVIDDNKTFVLNPEYNHVPQKGKWKESPPMYFESKEINRVYRTYYYNLWRRLAASDCEIGCILKDGPVTEGYDRYIGTIERNILGQSPKQAKKIGPEIINLEGLKLK